MEIGIGREQISPLGVNWMAGGEEWSKLRRISTQQLDTEPRSGEVPV